MGKDKIGKLENEDGKLDTEITRVDERLTRVDNELKEKVEDVKKELKDDIKELQSQLDDAIVTINCLEDALKGFKKKSSAHAAAGSIDLLDTDQTSVMSHVSQNTLIICLVVFNIGTILGCISCLFWSKRGRAKG